MLYGDTITLTGIHVRAAHGVLDSEKVDPQNFYVDIEFQCDTETAAKSDDVADAVNYAEVTERVVEAMTCEHADLIETLAQRVADAVLTDARIEFVKVTIHKPNAPIPHEFANVAVTIEREGRLHDERCKDYVISIGSNLGDSETVVRKAIAEVSAILFNPQVSSLYRSTPVLAEGQDAQPPYINAIVVGTAYRAPLEVLDDLQYFEREAGRVRTERWGARTLDLDVISVSDVESDHPRLLLPHPRSGERRFVLEPWYEVQPDAELAGTPIAELLERVQDQEIVRIEDGN